MKKIVILTLMTAMFATVVHAEEGGGVDVRIVVSGIKNQNGQLMIALWNNEATFLKNMV